MPNRTWVRIAQIGLAIGVALLLGAVIGIFTMPGKDDSPKCGGRAMLKTDVCIEHFSDGTTERRSYEDMKGHFSAAGATLVLAASVVLIGGSIWVWRRNRERPFQFAPFHITEKD